MLKRQPNSLDSFSHPNGALRWGHIYLPSGEWTPCGPDHHPVIKIRMCAIDIVIRKHNGKTVIKICSVCASEGKQNGWQLTLTQFCSFAKRLFYETPHVLIQYFAALRSSWPIHYCIEKSHQTHKQTTTITLRCMRATGLINAWWAPTTFICCADYRRRLPHLFVLAWHELATQEYHQYEHHCEDDCNSQNNTQDNIDVAWVVCMGLCEEEEKQSSYSVTVFTCYTLQVI